MPLPCRFALVSNSGAVEREGLSTLPGLGDAIRQAAKIVLLLAASDVSLLRVKVPPLSSARLKVALPNLVEDQLMSDPSECAFAAGAAQDGMRTVAVINRAWLEQLSAGLTALGARRLEAVPAQLCLPHQPPAVAAAVTEFGSDRDVALRWSEQDGIGFCIGATAQNGAESAAREVIDALRLMAPQVDLILQVAPAGVAAYQQAVADAGDAQLQIAAEDWVQCAAAAKSVTLNLMTGLGASAGPQVNWRPWRWPAALALLAAVVNIVGLNASRLQLQHEADFLHDGMNQTFRAAFPKESVIIDPVAQMRQKLSASKQGSGQAGPDDFLTLAGAFGNVWASLPQAQTNKAQPVIAAIEYRERSLLVRLKPADAVKLDAIRPLLAPHKLALTEQSAGVWQIRSAP
ncbi:MAG: general secretion pathway protein GspL [Glaciimonas sp.]|nr:general secretion pathway protein GspL [Glaciimonas sp.]